MPCNDAAFRAQDEELYVTKTAVSNAIGGGGAPATLLLDLQRARKALGGYLAAHPPCAEDLLGIAATEQTALDELDAAIAALEAKQDAGPHLTEALASLRVGAERAARRTIGFRARFRGSRKRPGNADLLGMEPLSTEVADPVAIDLPRFERACAAAVAAAASAESAADVFDGALRALHDELGGPGVAAFVLEHGRLWSVGVRGYAMIPDGLPLDDGVIGRAVRTSAAQLVLDVTEDPDFVEVSRATVSELSVPLVMPTGVVGVLNIETSEQLPAGSVDAIAGARSRRWPAPMDELRGSRTDLSSLARLFVYMSSLRDPRAIAEVAVRSLGRVLPVETSQLLLLDEDGQLVESTEWSATAPGPEPLPRRLAAGAARADRRLGRLRAARHERRRRCPSSPA